MPTTNTLAICFQLRVCKNPLVLQWMLRLIREYPYGASGGDLVRRLSAILTRGVVTPELAQDAWNVLVIFWNHGLLGLRNEVSHEQLKQMETSRALYFLHATPRPGFLRALRI